VKYLEIQLRNVKPLFDVENFAITSDSMGKHDKLNNSKVA